MDIIVKATKIEDINNIVLFNARITKNNSEIAKQSLKLSRQKIIDYLKALKEENKIKSIHRPRNKYLQNNLNRLILIKRELKSSIDKIQAIF